MKTLLIVGIFIIIILLPIGIWMQIKAKDRGLRHFETFYSAEIDSRIESIRIAFKGTGMKLSDGREFVFYPITDQVLNDGSIFNYTAEKKNRVIKKPYSDTMYLIKNDQKLAYTFKKF
ncbi:hypothetical protein PBT90_16385 [Algoriphagus halophytocola]|uniref:hypothetical protein n=1 Tax=Algoriphagus halophytocola TaxID=2991499 RepID=UPI0022DD2A31|nr:hypothetical protein [Algoriphagus sp. TR-M9]WBL42315.1 hypothetical protein PBT90_16385 [Algoriphagus sp. TR-M9]